MHFVKYIIKNCSVSKVEQGMDECKVTANVNGLQQCIEFAELSRRSVDMRV